MVISGLQESLVGKPGAQELFLLSLVCSAGYFLCFVTTFGSLLKLCGNFFYSMCAARNFLFPTSACSNFFPQNNPTNASKVEGIVGPLL